MKHIIQQLVKKAFLALGAAAQDIDFDTLPIKVDQPKNKSHGDFSCNIAMVLAKPLGQTPREIAANLQGALPDDAMIDKVEIAGPGFLNFYLSRDIHRITLSNIFEQGDAYGRCDVGKGQGAYVEFVSSNPTGPLHVGHGRGAAFGDCVASLLQAAGFDVHREYYVNDAGRQMDILTASIWLRYLVLTGESLDLPSNAYQGEYIIDIAKAAQTQWQDQLKMDSATLLADLPDHEEDKEAHIDAIIARAKAHLGDNYLELLSLGLNTILDDIRVDLKDFGVVFNDWFSERAMLDSEAIAQTLQDLKARDLVYEQNGALWFKASEYGDEKDRVVMRDNGQHTYFMADITYHREKFRKAMPGCDSVRIINIFGADHHGYVPRLKAAMQALGFDLSRFINLSVQFAILYRGEDRVQMSTRSGSFVTLRELREEIGRDACRFFYVMRKNEQHLDFDLELAKSHSKDNPVYYIQYAHARVTSVLRQLQEQNLTVDRDAGLNALSKLDNEHEQTLMDTLRTYPDVIESAALHYEPHLLTHYLRDLANDFHTYYNAHKFIVDDVALRHARVCLIEATAQVIRNGLSLLGVSAPTQM